MVQVSSVEIERTVIKHVPNVIRAAAVSLPAPGGGPETLVMFVVLRAQDNVTDTHSLTARCQAVIRQHLNPLFKLQQVIVRSHLPVNASNKVMRRVLRDELKASGHHLSKL